MVDRTNLEYFLVGGAVRDEILGREPNDKDYVVLSESEESMKRRGFTPIHGDSFLVFLDPETKDEYALARREKSTGPKHDDFEMEQVDKLETDLNRRDFTINAIAKDPESGEIIDPFDGKKDLESGVIRHVSDAFVEDPLRVVRGARYACRFGFSVFPETANIMRKTAPKISNLPNERIGDEVKKAMGQAQKPRRFFDVLKEVNALEYVAPPIEDLIGVPAGSPTHHKEGDSYEHTMLVLQAMYEKRKNDVPALLAAVSHDLGKAKTPEHILPRHHNHGNRGVEPSERLARDQWKLSNNFTDTMKKSAKMHSKASKIAEMRDAKVIRIVDKYWDRQGGLDLAMLLDVIEADGRGKIPGWDYLDPRIQKNVNIAKEAIKEIDGEYINENFDVSGEAFGNVLLHERIKKYRELKDEENE